MRIKRNVAICLLALLVTAGCAGRGGQSAQRPLVGEETQAPGKKDGKKAGKKAGKRAQKGKGAAAGATAGASGPQIAGSSGQIDPDVPGADEEKQYPTAFAELTEPGPDAQHQGITPDYAEMTAFSIEGLGEQFQATMTFGGEVPQEMPNDKTVMVVGFQVLRGEDEGYGFSGQATQKGWTPYAGGKDKQSKFPGSFEVNGNQIVMTIPWSYLDGAYPFKWIVTSSWFQSLANTTHYKFDMIPNQKKNKTSLANYPG